MKRTLVTQTVKDGVVSVKRTPVKLIGSRYGKNAYITVGGQKYIVDKVIADNLKAFLDGDITFFTVKVKEG